MTRPESGSSPLSPMSPSSADHREEDARAEDAVSRWRVRGIRVGWDGGSKVWLEGPYAPQDEDLGRRLKAALLRSLRDREDRAAYKRARIFPHRIGDRVGTPLGPGVLWGLSPRGPAVQLGSAIYGFDFDEVVSPPDP